MKILVTGFEPFGGAVINPAYEAVKLLPDVIVEAEVIKIEIPTVFGRDEEVVRVAVEKHHPDAVLCVGQAGGRSGITVEKVAINLMEARIPDNEEATARYTNPGRRRECIFCVAPSQEHGTVYERGKDPGARFLYSRNFCLQRYHVPCPLHDR